MIRGCFWELVQGFFGICGCLGYAWAAVRFCCVYFQTTAIAKWLFFGYLMLRESASGLPGLFTQWQTGADRAAVPWIILACLDQLLLFMLVLGLFRAERGKKILAAAMLIAVLTLAGHFCESVLSILLLYGRHQIDPIPLFVMEPWQLEAVRFCRLAAEAAVLFWLSRHPLRDFHGRTKTWYLTAALPLLAVTAVMDAADWGASRGILVRTEQMGLYYDQIYSHMLTLVLTALCMASAGGCLYGMDRIFLEQGKSSRYQARIAAYQMLEAQYSQSERLRHDLKNHLLALNGMLERKEWEQMEAYLRRMQDFGNMQSGEDLTGNRALDAVLCQKRTQAQKNGVQWECEVQVPKTCCMDAFDFCVLFGNLLDNALEACIQLPEQEKRWIRVRAGVQKKCFLMEVRNSAWSGKKAHTAIRPGRGIGLWNVRDLVEQYNGALEAGELDGIYHVSILMPLE